MMRALARAQAMVAPRVMPAAARTVAAAAVPAATPLFAAARMQSYSVRWNSHLHGTTILSVRRGREVVIIGDGQVTAGKSTVYKPNARKVRIIGNGKVICGFAGSTADCFALLEALEKKLEEYPGQLMRAAVELAKMWRTDKYLKQLQATLIAVDKDTSITLSGDGDVFTEPMDGIISVGSGGDFALAAARALVDVPGLTPRQIAVKSMRIAADLCVFTNKNFTIECFEDGELVTGAKRDALLAADRDLAEQLDREDRRKIEANSALSYSGIPDAVVTTPPPATPQPLPPIVPGVEPQTAGPAGSDSSSTPPPA